MQKFENVEAVLSYFSDLPPATLLEACHESHQKVPTQSGIYFWFLRKEGFEKLSRKFPVLFRPPNDLARVGDAYLICSGYVGTNTDLKTVREAKNLKYYFQFTIPHKPLEYSLLGYSLLPCFRKVISCLLCEDIMAEQETVRAFFNDYLLMHWIGYEPGNEEEGLAVNRAIKIDFKLIKQLLCSLRYVPDTVHDINSRYDYRLDDYMNIIREMISKCVQLVEENTFENIRKVHDLKWDEGRGLNLGSNLFKY